VEPLGIADGSVVFKIAIAVLIVLTACAGQPTTEAADQQEASPPAGPATEEPAAAPTEPVPPLQAVATVYPLAWVLEQVAPAADVQWLAAAGQDPHDMELTPSQRAAVEQADVVAYLGDIDFQPQVETAVGDAGGVVVDAAEVLGGDALRTYDGHAHDDEDDHGHSHDDEADDHAGEEGSVDPHLWFDARLLAQLAEAAGAAFAEADPDRADDYRANAEQTAQELDALAGQVDALLTGCRHDEVIVSHEAYAYLLEPHDLEQHGISGAGGHSEASPRAIAELAEEIREHGLPAVLTEPVEGRRDAEAVAAEAGVELIEIYSLDIVDEAQAARGFPDLLREQAEAVAEAAGCGG